MTHLNGHLDQRPPAEELGPRTCAACRARRPPAARRGAGAEHRQAYPADLLARAFAADRPTRAVARDGQAAGRRAGRWPTMSRLTLAGAGDPLLSPIWPDVVAAGRRCGPRGPRRDGPALRHPTTTCNSWPTAASTWSASTCPPPPVRTYAEVMGVDAAANARRRSVAHALHAPRQGARPWSSPRSPSCAANLGEMEDRGTTTGSGHVGHAVLVGPSTFNGRLVDVGVADMAPPKRRPCARLVVAAHGPQRRHRRLLRAGRDRHAQPMGRDRRTAPSPTSGETRFASLRACHTAGKWADQAAVRRLSTNGIDRERVGS